MKNRYIFALVKSISVILLTLILFASCTKPEPIEIPNDGNGGTVLVKDSIDLILFTSNIKAQNDPAEVYLDGTYLGEAIFNPSEPNCGDTNFNTYRVKKSIDYKFERRLSGTNPVFVTVNIDSAYKENCIKLNFN